MTPLQRDTMLAAREMAAAHAEEDRAECGPAMAYALERLDALLDEDDLEGWPA